MSYILHVPYTHVQLFVDSITIVLSAYNYEHMTVINSDSETSGIYEMLTSNLSL